MMRDIGLSCLVAAAIFSTTAAHAADSPEAPAAPAAQAAGSAPTAEQVDEARRLFKVGLALLGDPEGAKFEEARAQFQRAYDLSGNWKVLSNLGVCQLKLERDGEAIKSYEAYLVGGGNNIDADERAQVERDLGVLKAQVVTVRLSFPAAGATVADQRTDNRGNKIGNAYTAAAETLVLGLHPGDHVLTARLTSGAAKWETTLSPGSTVEHRFEVAPEPAQVAIAPQGAAMASPTTEQGAPAREGTRPITTAVWIGAGVTGALAVGALATGVSALGKRSDFDKVNDSAHSDAEKSAARDSATSMGLVNTVFSAAALVGAGVTAYLFFTRPEAGPPSERAERAERARRALQARTVVTPWVGGGGAGLVVGGVL
jgi:hypothetical protein